MKYLITLFFLVLWIFTVQSQSINRIEIPSDTAESFSVIPMGKNGVLLVTKMGDKAYQCVSLTMFNTAFEKIWTDTLKLNASLKKLTIHKTDSLSVTLLFRENTYAYLKGSYAIVKLNVINRDLVKHQGVFPVVSSSNRISVSQDKLYIHGTTVPTGGQICAQCLLGVTCIPLVFDTRIHKHQPIITILSLESGKAKVLRNNYKGYALYVGFNSDTTIGGVVGLVRNRVSNGYIRSSITYIDKDDQIVGRSSLGKDISKPILQAKWVPVDSFKGYAIGTYDFAPKRSRIFAGSSTKYEIGTIGHASLGLFISLFEDGNEVFSKYYPFSDIDLMKNIVDPFSKKRKSKRGLPDVPVQFLQHNPIKTDEGFIIIGEIYKTEFRKEPYTDENGRWKSKKVFDGYRFLRAVIFGISNDGELLWNKSFPLGGKSYERRLHVSTRQENDKITLLYNDAGSVSSRSIMDGHVMRDNVSKILVTKFTDDKLINATKSKSSYWYNDFFLVYGYNELKSKTAKANGEQKKRNVFYFQKLEVKN